MHIGERKAGAPRVSLMHYDGEQLVEEEVTDVPACRAWLSRPGVTWINIEGVHQIDLLEQFGAVFGLHPLVLEDIANTGQRPKVEDYGGYLYIVLRMLSLHPHRHRGWWGAGQPDSRPELCDLVPGRHRRRCL